MDGVHTRDHRKSQVSESQSCAFSRFLAFPTTTRTMIPLRQIVRQGDRVRLGASVPIRYFSVSRSVAVESDGKPRMFFTNLGKLAVALKTNRVP